MKPSKDKPALTTQAGVATAVTASAVSLTFMPVLQETGNAQNAPAPAWQLSFSEDDCFNKYFENGYGYTDALVLAAYWNEASPADAKLRLGDKMLRWGPEDGDIHIRHARSEALKEKDEDLPLWYTDAGYTYDDAELLASYWGNDLADTKYTMNRLLIGGHEQVLQAALNSAGR